MAFVIADRVRESSTTTGTGNFMLGGAVIGYQTFDTVLDTGDTTYYTIADQGGANWEVGIGTFTSPSTLARTTILSSSNGGSIVTFTAGTKDVFISLPASKTNTNDQPNVIAVNSTSDALRITQTGTGNALVVEDSANPDSSPVVVDSTGRLNVGGTVWYNTASVTPSTQFNGTGQGASLALNAWQSGTNVPARIYFNRADSNTVGDFSDPVDSGDNLGVIHWAGSDGSGFIEAATINAAVDGTPGLNDMPGRLVFSTTADGASTPTERMRIGSTGNIGIGTAGSEPFTIRNLRNFSGATTAYGISQGGEVQSGVTSTVYVNHTAPTTQAAAFNISNVYHYGAVSLSLGAGSTVTNQYGFVAQSGLTAATNNYGFWSNIASGTGRWNFYAAGTADNFFGGPTTISTSSTSDAVRITQTGTGNALVVEDAANPDSSPFIVDTTGRVLAGVGTTSLALSGVIQSAVGGATLSALTTNAGTTSARTHWRLGVNDVEVAGIGTSGTSMTILTNAVERLLMTNTGATSLTVTGTGGVSGLALSVVGTNLSGATTNAGINVTATFGLGATVRGIGVQTSIATEAGGAGLNTGSGFRAIQGTFGTAVTNQYGYWADSTLTGGTNNYGFFSDIASGANRWNFYANGTAANYFAGQVQLGAGTAAAPALSTTGDTNTGIFFPAADTIAFSTAGTEDFRIGSAGQLGVQGANYGTAGQVLTSGGPSAAPSWATVSATGRLINTQVFTSSGTYTRTAGVTTAVVIAVGAGGGGTGSNGTTAGGNGGNGGTTSFGSHVTAAGGSGSTGRTGGAGGTGGTGATLAIKGQGGGASSPTGPNSGGGNGGGQGGGAGVNANNGASAGNAGVRGGGGSGAATYVGGCCAGTYGGGGGGQGETCIDYITTVGATETVTIGAGGTAGTGSSAGGAGGAGYIIVYEYS